MRDKVSNRTDVQILAVDPHESWSARHLLKDRDAVAGLCHVFGCHEPGQTGTDDNDPAPGGTGGNAVHHLPMFGADFQGSAGALASPFCRISMEMLSGERTNAMLPSRGGRLIVTPALCSLAQVS